MILHEKSNKIPQLVVYQNTERKLSYRKNLTIKWITVTVQL